LHFAAAGGQYGGDGPVNRRTEDPTMIDQVRATGYDPTRFHRSKNGVEIKINSAATELGRRVALHVDCHHFAAAHGVLNEAERNWTDEQLTPDRLCDLPLDRMNLGERDFNALYTGGFRSAADLVCKSDEELLDVQQIGPLALSRIREKCDYWISRLADQM
jgi:DNA-directed RNA polymerase alpha subunit